MLATVLVGKNAPVFAIQLFNERPISIGQRGNLFAKSIYDKYAT
jgi:hypothetical protein